MAVGSYALARASRFNPGILALIAAMAIWGVTLVITKAALNDVGPFTLLVARFGIALVILAPFARRKGFRLSMSVKPVYLAFGITGIVLHNGLETIGLQFTSAGSGALVIAAVPAVTAALSVIFLKERVTLLQSAGIGISMAGVAIVTNAGVSGPGSSEVLGNLLVFAGVVAWSIYTIQGKKLSTEVPAIVSTAAGIGAAVLLLTPMAVRELAVEGIPQVSLPSFLGIVYLGAFASALAYALWNMALDHVDASVAGPYVNLVPVIGLLAALMIGEPTNGFQLAGGGVVGAGLWLSEAARLRPYRRAASKAIAANSAAR